MAVRLHVGNLAWSVSADDLYRLFQPFGRVLHAQVVVDRERGWSRGFGFVAMADETEARNAIASLNGQLYRARPLRVAETRSEEVTGETGAPG